MGDRGRLMWRVTRMLVQGFWWAYGAFKTTIRYQQLLVGWTPVLVAGVPVYLLRKVGLLPQAAVEFWWRVVHHGIKKSGPAFTKFVRRASTRSDILPETVCRRLDGATKSHTWSETLAPAFGRRGRDELTIVDGHEPVGSEGVALQVD